MTYGPYSEARLTIAQKTALAEMRADVRKWVDNENRWMDWDFNFQDRWLEENTMAGKMWPGGVQPVAGEVVQSEMDGKVTLTAPTEGSVIRYSVASPAERKLCNQLPDSVRAASNTGLTLTNPGFPAEMYTIVSTKRQMMGFVYNKNNARGRGMQWSWFMGREKDTELFVKEDGTFMELACPTNMNVFVWDSRDAMWNGFDYGGKVDANGDWIGAKVTLDKVIVGLPYLFGNDRDIVWGQGGTDLHQVGFLKDGKPNEMYYAWPGIDLIEGPPPVYGTTPGIKSMIWSLTAFHFHSTATDGEDNQGSLKFTLDFRGLGPSRKETVFVAFHSYDYDECLYWQVGHMADLKPAGISHVFTQAVRKGYMDSKIRETIYTKEAPPIVDVKKPNGPNIMWMLVDDSTTDKWPESGNMALAGKMPGFAELKASGAVFYSHAYSAAPLCAPSQVSLLTGMNPGDVGGQHQFAAANMPGKANYRTVPPAEVKFFPEIARGWGYWATGAGKLDYQVGEVMPTFYVRMHAPQTCAPSNGMPERTSPKPSPSLSIG